MNILLRFFKGFKKGMYIFGQNTAVLINSILLFIVYVIGVGLTAIFAKVLGKHFLGTEVSKEIDSYWSDLDLKKESLESYYRQF